MKKLSKAELVDLINGMPGPKVTDRPNKGILMEIYEERMKEEFTAHEIVETSCNCKVCCERCCSSNLKNNPVLKTLAACVALGLVGCTLYLAFA